MTRLSNPLIILASLFFLWGNGHVQAAAKDEHITVTYDVGPLLQRGSKSGYESVDDVAKSIVNQVNPHSWLLTPDGGNRIFEVNGSKLEILATRKDHEEIKDLLKAMQRLFDVAVELKSAFISVDAKWYEKEIVPLLKELPKDADPEDEETTKKHARIHDLLNKNSEVMQSGRIRLANGREELLASLRQVHAFATGDIDENGNAVWGVEWTGVSYRCKSTVSADRRFVNVKLEESLRGPGEKRDGVSKLKTDKSKREVLIPDGGTFYLSKCPYIPESAAKRGRFLVLVIEARIIIEEEEKEREGKNRGS